MSDHEGYVIAQQSQDIDKAFITPLLDLRCGLMIDGTVTTS